MPTKTRSTHNPPATLDKSGARLWGEVMEQYEITDVGGLAILQQACQCLDRAEACAAQIESEGLTITTAQGVRAHPLLNHEMTARGQVCRLLAKLGLNLEPVKGMGRPSGDGVGIGYNR